MLGQLVNCLWGHVGAVAQTSCGAMDASMPGVCLGDPLAIFFISIFFHPLTWMAQKKVLEWHFFMQKTTKEDYEKIWKNPQQYQHKRYKQSATCHKFLYIKKYLWNDPKKRLGIIRVICLMEKKPRGGWEVGRKYAKIILVKKSEHHQEFLNLRETPPPFFLWNFRGTPTTKFF